MTTQGPSSRARRAGGVLIYAMVAMVAFIGLCSLAVDYGRAQVVKTELRTAADAAARAGAGGLAYGPEESFRRAKWIARENSANNAPLVLTIGDDFELGRWDKKERFKPDHNWGPGNRHINACRVTARRTAARGDGVPLAFASMFGQKTLDVSVEAIAVHVPAVEVDERIAATANPFLAGMPKGTVASLNNPHNSPDFAGTKGQPMQSPFAVEMPLVEGQALTFDSIGGTAKHDPSLPYFEPDGNLWSIDHNTNGSEHGIADMTAPINSLVGVFLSDEQPDRTAAPRSLDFSSEKSRDFDKLEPQLKQIFFIGDGRNAAGKRQEFVVPKGATRLFLATWDFYEWNNNDGYRVVKVSRPEQVILVQ